MSKIFSQVQSQRPPSNGFDLSHDRKFSTKFGQITPILVMDIVPGDSVKISSSQMLRFAPMITPPMHAVNVFTHFFFVPNRILWSNWEKFITGGEDGTDASVFPNMNINNSTQTPLSDYLGIPSIAGAFPQNISVLPFAAYQKIYNEYYRDQNLITPVELEVVDGDNAAIRTELTTIRNRAWQHDYFTSALPWTQKGTEATIPLGDYAPLKYTPNGAGDVIRTASNGNPIVGTDMGVTGQASPSGQLEIGTIIANIDNTVNTVADLSGATASSINDLRRAFRLQEWLERNARGGSRYIEAIKSHFGVTSDDARLQRPEFLGGGTTPVQFSEVLQTSAATSEPSPLGTQGGHGIAVGQNASVRYSAKEHGYVIGLQTIMPKSAYQQGVPKHFIKFDKLDYYWPSFAHLGEQPILNKEIYADNEDGQDDNTFGYTPRYAEYKFINSSVHGEFRTTLDFWHLGRKFSSRPALNQQFIEMQDTEAQRIFAVSQSEQLYVYLHNKITARRLMPVFGTPTI